jgi:hypothetical protein
VVGCKARWLGGPKVPICADWVLPANTTCSRDNWYVWKKST